MPGALQGRGELRDQPRRSRSQLTIPAPTAISRPGRLGAVAAAVADDYDPDVGAPALTPPPGAECPR
ncbi:hypothetical protein, partial [Streptomyces africanus]|uniref:hypothetical protein n=1 Tax=Streptomyces africanus TaxID=231024 RepID=UPI001ABFC988